MTATPAGRLVVRVGIVGAGFAARSHLDALRRVPGIEVVGLAASSPERSREAGAELGVTPFDDYRALLDDRSIDAIHACAPNDLHLEIDEAALAAGKHVLSEKPLGRDAAETARLVELADRSDVVTGVCFTYRHFPLVQHLRAELASGEHGPVHLITGAYLQDWLLLPTDWNWRLDPERGGASRAVADIGSHWIDLVQHLTDDRIAEVCADLGTLHAVRRRPTGDVETFTSSGEGTLDGLEDASISSEDWASVLFRTERGVRGAFTVSQVSAGRKNHLTVEIDAADASLTWDQERPNTLWIGRRSGPNELVPRDPSLVAPEAAPLVHYPGGHQEGWPDALRNLFVDFYGTVRARHAGEDHPSAVATFADAHRTTQTVEAILASHADRRWVRIAATEEVRT